MIASYRSPLIAGALAVAAVILWFTPPPAGASQVMMHAAALVVLAIGCWATMLIP